MTQAQRKAWTGFFYICPWLIGFLYFFLDPFLRSLIFSLSHVKLGLGGVDLTFVGVRNYIFAFTADPKFVRALTTAIIDIASKTPMIIVYSLFIATILNQKFVGRTLTRAVFFLPVIIASGVVIQILRGDAFSRTVMDGERSSALFESEGIMQVLFRSGLHIDIVRFIQDLVNDIFELSWRSGIQILVFLAGLQTIPKSMYEAAEIEGATGWESFWKVTFPLITPMILVNVVYTIVDGFVDYSNPVMYMIAIFSRDLKMAYSSTLSWIYFIIVFIIIIVVYGFINKRVFYRVDK